jgi:hypothetical protein
VRRIVCAVLAFDARVRHQVRRYFTTTASSSEAKSSLSYDSVLLRLCHDYFFL